MTTRLHCEARRLCSRSSRSPGCPGGLLGGCTASRNGLGTHDSVCFRVYPEARAAVHDHGQVRRRTVPPTPCADSPDAPAPTSPMRSSTPPESRRASSPSRAISPHRPSNGAGLLEVAPAGSRSSSSARRTRTLLATVVLDADPAAARLRPRVPESSLRTAAARNVLFLQRLAAAPASSALFRGELDFDRQRRRTRIGHEVQPCDGAGVGEDRSLPARRARRAKVGPVTTHRATCLRIEPFASVLARRRATSTSATAPTSSGRAPRPRRSRQAPSRRARGCDGSSRPATTTTPLRCSRGETERTGATSPTSSGRARVVPTPDRRSAGSP